MNRLFCDICENEIVGERNTVEFSLRDNRVPMGEDDCYRAYEYDLCENCACELFEKMGDIEAWEELYGPSD